MLDSKISIENISKFTGLKKSRIFELRQLYQRDGIETFKSKSRNIKELLTKAEIKEICQTVKYQKPKDVDEYFSHEEFWTLPILTDFIWRRYEVRYKSRTSYYAIFKRIKFTFHKPGRVYVKQNPEEVREWIKETTPVIKKAWEDPNTVILCEDESLLSTQVTTQKVWLEANSYPKVEVNTKRHNRSIYGFLNIKTGREQAFIAPYQTMYETARVLKKICQIYPKNDNRGNKVKGVKKILLLWDSAGWHRGSKAQEYIQKDGRIIQIFFPRYTPELNPQEHVWNEGKEKVVKNKYIPDVERTAKDFVEYLNSRYFEYKFLGFKSGSL